MTLGEMTLGELIFITFVFICVTVTALAVDYAQSTDKGWTPLYKLLFRDPVVRAWHLFWLPLTSVYKKWRKL